MGVVYCFNAYRKMKDGNFVKIEVPNDSDLLSGQSYLTNFYNWFICFQEGDESRYVPYREIWRKSQEEYDKVVWTNPNLVLKAQTYNKLYFDPAETDDNDPLGFACKVISYDGIILTARVIIERIDALLDWLKIYGEDYSNIYVTCELC